MPTASEGHRTQPQISTGCGITAAELSFGQVTKGQDIVDALTKGDKIITVEILDDTKALFEAQAKNIQKWNAVLQQR